MIDFWFISWSLPSTDTWETVATIGSGLVLALFAFVAFWLQRARYLMETEIVTTDTIAGLYAARTFAGEKWRLMVRLKIENDSNRRLFISVTEFSPSAVLGDEFKFEPDLDSMIVTHTPLPRRQETIVEPGVVLLVDDLNSMPDTGEARLQFEVYSERDCFTFLIQP